MDSVRVAFDTSLPAFLASEQQIGGRTFKADEPLPWRELDISEHMLHDFWRAGLVYFKAAEKPAKIKPRS